MNTEGIAEFNLTSEIEEFESRKPWPKGLTSKTLLKSGDLRIVLIAMESTAKMQEHHSDGRISIHVLSGNIRMRVQREEKILGVGHLIALDRSVKHDVEAMEDSVFLLTIAWPTEQELAGLKHRGDGY